MGLANTSSTSRRLRVIGGGLLAAAALTAGLVTAPAAQASGDVSAGDAAASTRTPHGRHLTFRLAGSGLEQPGVVVEQPGVVVERPGPEHGPAGSGRTGARDGYDGRGSASLASSILGGTAGADCARTVNVVAHQDDDLLFINPAVSEDIADGKCVVTVFVTAGDAGRRPGYWRSREEGAMAAYAAMAGAPNDWTADTVDVGGHRIARAGLDGLGIALLFLRLPDGHGNPKRPGESLQRLWRGQTPAISALDTADTYTLDDLIGTLTSIMEAVQPDQVRTLDYHGRYGDGDHNDHLTVGYLTYEAQRAYASAHRVTGYLGYPVAQEPENLTPAVRDRKLAFFLAYAPHDKKVCHTAEACLTNFYAPRFSHSIPTGTELVPGPPPHPKPAPALIDRPAT